MRAANRVIEIQKNFGGEVVVFHSVLHNLSKKSPQIDSDSISKENNHEGKEILKKVEELFKKANLSAETRLIFDIQPAEYIKKVVEKEGFNLVVLGSKGKHKKFRRALLGSIPSKVTNNVLCDVLVVR